MEMDMERFFKTVPSPLGDLKVVASDHGLTAILWPHDDPKRVRVGDVVERPDHPVLRHAERQLQEYFAGTREAFDIDLDFVGTPFQKSVWEQLLAIPFGETRSYAQIAGAIGNAKAVRAVGAANGKNPISIVAPCHRVFGSDGSMTGFAGGIEVKRFLLSHEGRAHAA
jgi:methylated-DNA-[protein]-cysteine S-methyltransferase